MKHVSIGIRLLNRPLPIATNINNSLFVRATPSYNFLYLNKRCGMYDRTFALCMDTQLGFNKLTIS